MKKTFIAFTAILLFTGLFISNTKNLYAQSGASAVLDSATISSQLDYIYENTRVYNDYRAIRDDIFRKLKRNVTDTLNAAMLEVEQLHSRLTEREFQIETLNTDLARTNKELEEAVRNRDSLSFLGIQMNKALYNTIMWFIILGLIALSVFLVMMFRRTHQVTKEIREELETVREEFEQYRKSSREKYEKLVISHHNEILKLKNN